LVGREYVRLLEPRNGLYCSLNVDGFSRYMIPAYCAALMLGLLGFEIAIFVKYWKTRTNASRAFTLLKRDLPFSFLVRMSLFSLASVMVLSVGVFFISDDLIPYPYMLQATLPLLAVVVFGMDLLQLRTSFRHPHPKLQLNLRPLRTSDVTIQDAHIGRQAISSAVSAGGSRSRYGSAPSIFETGTLAA